MKTNLKRSQKMTLFIIGGIVLLTILLNDVLNLSQTAVIVIVIVGSLLFSANAIWYHAVNNANGDEWWQDDDASGWRGY